MAESERATPADHRELQNGEPRQEREPSPYRKIIRGCLAVG
jgi:hypothetical protein